MKSLRQHAERPIAVPLLADDVVEFHAARILLLLFTCGRGGAIAGLTKMAKLDFFVRYPDFFEAVAPGQLERPVRSRAVEAAMVRHRYGPWDKRYYHVLAFLEARALIEITKPAKTFRLGLTAAGKRLAKSLTATPAFAATVEHMQVVGEVFGGKTGNQLKTLIYNSFADEVASQPLGHTIRASE